ncbi:helix-turn-helix transcriptional regulator [Gordonia soli]|nr:WYL domain-containing protein [Gordonia soli]
MATTSARLLDLLSLLQARRDWPAAVLADRLAISTRTVRRDVDRLRELGYPIAAFKGPDGGYRLEPGSELPPLRFDDDQAVAVAIALQLATTAGAGLAEASVRALTTIRQLMPARLRHRVDLLQVSAIDDRRTPGVDGVDERLLAVGEAIRGTETLRFDYVYESDTRAAAPSGSEPSGPRPPRQVEPHHLVTRNGRWYVVGWEPSRADWRTYRLDRMVLRSPNGPRFTPREIPDGDLNAFVLSRFRGSTDHSGTWPCVGVVILDLPLRAVAPYVDDGSAEPVGTDRCRLRSGAWSWIALAAQLGRFDADVEVVEPPELRQAFAELAARYTRAVG